MVQMTTQNKMKMTKIAVAVMKKEIATMKKMMIQVMVSKMET